MNGENESHIHRSRVIKELELKEKLSIPKSGINKKTKLSSEYRNRRLLTNLFNELSPDSRKQILADSEKRLENNNSKKHK